MVTLLKKITEYFEAVFVTTFTAVFQLKNCLVQELGIDPCAADILTEKHCLQ
jgi:hypothetical protein